MEPVSRSNEGVTVDGPISAEIVIDFSQVPAPASVSFAHFSRLGEEVSMVLGFVNIPAAANAMHSHAVAPTPGVFKLKGTPTDSFVMSLSTFSQLRERMNAFAALLERGGIELTAVPSAERGK